MMATLVTRDAHSSTGCYHNRSLHFFTRKVEVAQKTLLLAKTFKLRLACEDISLKKEHLSSYLRQFRQILCCESSANRALA